MTYLWILCTIFLSSSHAETKLAPTQNPTPETVAFEKNRIEITPDYHYSKVTSQSRANRAQATLSTKLNFGLEFVYSRFVKENFSIQGLIGARTHQFNSPGNKNIHLINDSPETYEVGIGAGFLHSPRLKLDGWVGYRSELFLKGVSVNANQFETTWVPFLRLAGSYDVYIVGDWTFGALVGMEAAFPRRADSYDTHFNPGYRSQIFSKKPLGSSELQLGLVIKKTYQNTSLVEQDQMDYGIELKWRFPVKRATQ